MTSGMKTVISSVTDLAAAKQVYSMLFGMPPEMDEPYYVGFRVDGLASVWTRTGTIRG